VTLTFTSSLDDFHIRTCSRTVVYTTVILRTVRRSCDIDITPFAIHNTWRTYTTGVNNYERWHVFAREIPDVWKWTSYVKSFESYRITACECVHLVTRGHFRSRDKSGGHTIRFPIAKYPVIHANITALSFTQSELWAVIVLHCGNRDFRLFWSVTLTLTRWPSYTNFNWPVFPEDTGEVQISTSDVEPFESYTLCLKKHTRHF